MRNRNSKIPKIITIITIIAIILTGCFNKTLPPEQNTGVQGNKGESFVIDYLGREVEIPEKVENIACAYAYSGHVVTLLGEGDKIVAGVGGLQRDKLITDMYPHIKDIPVPFSSGTINIEELLKTKPDIVFIRNSTATNKTETDKLNKFNIPYVTIEYNSIDEQIESIRTIGKVLGQEEKANKYIDYYTDTIEYIEKVVSTIPEDEKVSIYHTTNEAARTASGESIIIDWINRVGVNNVVKEEELMVSGNDTYATLEQIYIWDPDVILANEPGVPEYIMTDEKWAGLRAVANGKVYQLPIGMSRWGHHGSLETPIAMLWVSKLLYPEYYNEINIEQKTKEYYKNFYDLDLNEEEIQDIFNGAGMRADKN